MIVLNSGKKKQFILDMMMSPGISSKESQNMKQNAEISPTATVLKSTQLWPESESLLELLLVCINSCTQKMKF